MKHNQCAEKDRMNDKSASHHHIADLGQSHLQGIDNWDSIYIDHTMDCVVCTPSREANIVVQQWNYPCKYIQYVSLLLYSSFPLEDGLYIDKEDPKLQ